MDAVATFAELQELVLLSEASIDSQFQFWLTATFAVIVASFIGSNLLTKTLRHIVALLYLLSTFVFASRWYHNYLDLMIYADMIQKLGFEVLVPYSTALSRIALMAMGTITAIYFVYSARHGGNGNDA